MIEDDTLSVSRNSFAWNDSGSYYTPNALVGLILDRTLERRLHSPIFSLSRALTITPQDTERQ